MLKFTIIFVLFHLFHSVSKFVMRELFDDSSAFIRELINFHNVSTDFEWLKIRKTLKHLFQVASFVKYYEVWSQYFESSYSEFLGRQPQRKVSSTSTVESYTINDEDLHRNSARGSIASRRLNFINETNFASCTDVTLDQGTINIHYQCARFQVKLLDTIEWTKRIHCHTKLHLQIPKIKHSF